MLDRVGGILYNRPYTVEICEAGMVEIAGFTNISGILGPGIYALLWRGSVVYIGQSKKMLTRIYTHRANRGKDLSKYEGRWVHARGISFDDVWILPCKVEVLKSLEAELIELYKPRYNVMVKTPSMITREIVLRHGDFEIVLNRPKAPPVPTVIVGRRL